MKKFSSNKKFFLVALGLAITMAVPQMSFATPVISNFSPSVPSPQPVGTLVTWTATASDPDPGTLTYAFSVGLQNGKLSLARDYGYNDSFPAYPALQEGNYTIQVVVRNDSTGNTATASATWMATAIASSTNPVVISTTANPLVALFSAAACKSPNSMLVQFKDTMTGGIQMTPPKACNGKSMNFYIAGMYATTPYAMTGILENAGKQTGQTATKQFTTGAIPSGVKIPTITVVQPAPTVAASEPIMLHGFGPTPYHPTGTDLSGNVLWYYLPYDGAPGFVTRPTAGGFFWYYVLPSGGDPYLQPLREVDVAGNTVVETNVGRINEQLVAAGQMPLTDVDHELRQTADGNWLMIGALDKILGPNIQNGADIIFNEVIVLNPQMQLLWSWNSTTCGNCATMLPPTRAAILGETCTNGQGGCPPLTPPNTIANDWLHSNSVQLAPDGSIVLSIRHQDWVIKIDYNNGKGTGNILWRLGLDGDFTLIPDPNDDYPWFSHQHDAEYQFLLPYIALFDNGNTRIRQFPTENSRGQMLKIDESTMTATLSYNLDVGVQSEALGTAQLLTDGKGHYTGLHFEPGFVNQTSSQPISFFPNGTLIMDASTTAYRAFQMHDLYTPYTQP